ncbi:peptidase MA family metallohydrolase [candidate division CSSED10-310 bacterium]|uniref:Peptidase MA family metallohydrolase n=1 Tax=candidate division CSSED10-310 bacterium TaxID=2855610 RepID=A0ABV6Z253_UNCC1
MRIKSYHRDVVHDRASVSYPLFRITVKVVMVLFMVCLIFERKAAIASGNSFIQAVIFSCLGTTDGDQSSNSRDGAYRLPHDVKLKLFTRATRHFMDRNFEKALNVFKKLAKLDKQMNVYVGITQYYLEDYGQARDTLQEVLVSAPDDAIALKFLALSFYNLNELEKSLYNVEASLEIRGDTELQAFKNVLKREIKAMKGYGKTERVNFNVVFSKFEHSDTKGIVIDYLEEAYRTIGRQMDFYPPQTVTVILYNEKNFFDITRSPGWAGGLYDGKIRLPIGGITGNEPELKRILFHEYTHALVHALTRRHRCPTWLEEGLAEYLSTQYRSTIGQVIPLSSLENGFPSGDPRIVLMAYLESYSAVTHMVDRYKLFRIKEFLELLGSGEDLNSAFVTNFSISYDRFLETWGK